MVKRQIGWNEQKKKSSKKSGIVFPSKAMTRRIWTGVRTSHCCWSYLWIQRGSAKTAGEKSTRKTERDLCRSEEKFNGVKVINLSPAMTELVVRGARSVTLRRALHRTFTNSYTSQSAVFFLFYFLLQLYKRMRHGDTDSTRYFV